MVTRGNTSFRILRRYYPAVSSQHLEGSRALFSSYLDPVRVRSPRAKDSHPSPAARQLSPAQARVAGTAPQMRTTVPPVHQAPTSRA